MNVGKSTIYARIWAWLPVVIILLGIALRLIVYIDNRCLWTDEVAIALNIAEKNFTALAQPLDYKQYAPPIFMWLVKASSILFGYGEKALRLYPLLSGIAALLMFSKVLRQHVNLKAAWYPLLIFATGIFYLRYGTELKQYMPDALVTLIIIWLAKRIDITKTKPVHFTLIWLLAGTIAIWSSMPSVFILAGVGCYYGGISVQHRNYKSLLTIGAIAIVWLAQFTLYYHTILSQQIQSDYLVSYHEKYFLAFPMQDGGMNKNADLVKGILQNTFGGNSYFYIANNALIAIGILVLLLKRQKEAILILSPVIFLLLAAMFKQYSLIPRLALFAMPLLLLCAGMGLAQLLKVRAFQIPAIIILLVLFVINKPLHTLSTPIRQEQVTDALDYIVQQKITAKQLYIYTGAIESYRYYTETHPARYKWKSISNANLITEDTDVALVASTQSGKSALLYSIPFDSYFTRSIFERFNPLTGEYQTNGCSVFIFKKQD